MLAAGCPAAANLSARNFQFRYEARHDGHLPDTPTEALFHETQMEGSNVHTEEKKRAYVLSMCQRVEREFTLNEIVSRMLDERPEMILEFAETWGNLIQSRKIRICKPGRPNMYEVVSEGDSSTNRAS
jgi:hypothetical protein